MCKVVLVWIVIKEEKSVDVGVGVRARVQYIRDSQQIELKGHELEQVFPENRAQCVGINQWEGPLLTVTDKTMLTYGRNECSASRHALNIPSLVCLQASPRHQPGGVWRWRPLWNHRWLRDRTQLRLGSIWEGEALLLYDVFETGPFLVTYSVNSDMSACMLMCEVHVASQYGNCEYCVLLLTNKWDDKNI